MGSFVFGVAEMKLFAFLLFVVVASFVSYGVWILLTGWSIIRGAPREDMFICPKGHGPLSKSALINFMGEEYCSICFHQKMKQAERGELR